MKKHILVISQYFYPEQFRINDICLEWIRRGYQVTVITGIPNYPEGRYFPGYGLLRKRKDSYQGISIRRIPLMPRGKSKGMLALNYISFVISGFFWSLFTTLKADTVFIFEVSPMTQALPGIWFARKRKIPCNIYVQDLWPENVEIMTGLKNKKMLGIINRMVDYIYKRSKLIFTTSDSFVKAIASRGVPLEKIICWPQYAEDYNQPAVKSVMPEIPDDGVFNIVFAGNIGHAQGLDILPRAAALLKQQDIRVRFNIIGDGRFKIAFIQDTKDNGVAEWFNFIERQPATRIPEFLAANDAAFLSLADSPLFSMTIPAKLQTYLACGIPVIAAAEGETRKIIEDAGNGFCSPAGDAGKLTMNIAKLVALPREQLEQMAHNGLEYCKRNFDKRVLLDKMDTYLELNRCM